MKTSIVLALCAILVLQSVVEAQRNRDRPGRGGVRGGSGGRGSGGPSGVRFPTDDEDRGRGAVSSGGLKAGKWPGGFYAGHN
ncbi:hypothetical protein CEXT_814771 [Caerostris extrusa]|uniref:Uncharacterized protein n=1 Tax=Caerostris extrusa TaxID=172846 RepID=A0AAV4VMA2_CAEEX|nr:hypothetical protein CEXT_814771 [Caerostris extrusa]